MNAVSLAFTVAGVAGILTAIGLVVAAPLILSMIGLQSSTDLLIRYGRWPLLALLLLLGLAVLYRYAPSRRSPKWRWISVGSVVATFTWMIGSGLLSYYLANFGNYDATFGSLGAAIALMIWMWMSTIVVLFGAELNSEIEHLRWPPTARTASKSRWEAEAPRWLTRWGSVDRRAKGGIPDGPSFKYVETAIEADRTISGRKTD